MPGKVNELILTEIEKELTGAPYVFFGTFKALKVADMEELRRILKPIGERCLVVKNRLAKLAFKKLGRDVAGARVAGMSCVMTAKAEPQIVSKKLFEFAKTREENFKVTGALLDGQVVDQSYVKQLAALPSKQELRGAVVCTIKAPITHFVLNLGGILRSLVNVLNAASQKETKAGG